MKICHISDTHKYEIDLPKADMLIHSGDATGRGRVEEVAQFAHWMNGLPFTHKVFVPGNHDWLFETNKTMAIEMMVGVHVLIDREVTIDGIRIYGSPWSPRFCDWAFNADGEISSYWDMIPNGLDILITHSPPMGILDQIYLTTKTQKGSSHLGCPALLERVKVARPRYHLFGHIHGGYGKRRKHGVRFINGSTCNEGYRPINKPMVFDISPTM